MENKHILGAVTVAAAAFLLVSCKPAQDVRTMHYFPDGRDIVCLNGSNRYTRALYGTHTRFRMETSDRPVFASYDADNSWNYRFYLTLDGVTRQLDSTARCEARYRGGRRSYTLRDDSWGRGELRITLLASQFEEGAIWKVEAEGFRGTPVLQVKQCRIANTRFSRNGDLGVDPRESFEASPDERDLKVVEWEAAPLSYLLLSGSALTVLGADEGGPLYAKEGAAWKELAEMVEINTPDPFFNTLGSNMVHAGDAIWDGTSYLHGAVGWRSRYLGWRGAYTGDVMGWNDRARTHFASYTTSMVTDVPPIYEHPQQGPENNLARSRREWGTPMYSNGYICNTPGRTDQISHYDMNLNYIDEMMRHFGYDADPEFMRRMWPYIVMHHQWEKRNFDPDGDHLYDAYACIWASDALYYNGGAVTHSSAYNYLSNLKTARIAEIIGEDPAPYREEAEAILKAMNERLWLDDLGHWAEFQDLMGLGRIHPSAAVWSVYTPIDCGACTPEQAYRATVYVDKEIPHIPVRYDYDRQALRSLGLRLPKPQEDLFTISTSDWMPYVWSTNNVAHAEVANMALAYLQAGRNDSGFKLLKADLLDEMYLGLCPGNFGQISWYDKARNEAYRDFADNVGITSRAILNGLFGILPDALNGQCILKPAFPDEWKEASVKTPYLSYSFRREGKRDIYEVEQHFPQPLQIIVRANAGGGAYLEVEGSSEAVQTIVVDRTKLPEAPVYKPVRTARADASDPAYMTAMGLDDISPRAMADAAMVDISAAFNSNVDDIFRNQYLSPRAPVTTLEIPMNGVGDWCTPFVFPDVEDDGLRRKVSDGIFDTGLGVTFLSPAEGWNIAYTSLWDNYPDAIDFPLKGSASCAYLLMAGSTNNMQSRIDNGVVTVTYRDGGTSVMPLQNPINWCSVEQDYYRDDAAFWTSPKYPYRVMLDSGRVSRDVTADFVKAAENGQLYDYVKTTDRGIPGGAAQILKMPLEKGRELASLELRTLSNDVVIGLMAITLEK